MADGMTVTLMDRYPEMQLRPASEFNMPLLFFGSRVDYVEKLVCGKERERFHRIAHNGRFGVLHWKKGFITDSAEIIIPCKYDYIHPMHDRMFKAEKGGKAYFFDLVGRELNPMLQEQFPEVNLRPASEYNIPMMFFNKRVDFIEKFDPKAGKDQYLRISKNGKFGLLRLSPGMLKKSAEIIVPCDYDFVYPEENGIFKAVKKDVFIFFDKIGKVLK